MSDNGPKDPLEELKKEFNKLLENNPDLGDRLNRVIPSVMGAGGVDLGGKEAPQDDEPTVEASESDKEALERIRKFNLKPREIRDYLNRFVIKQPDAKKVLSVSICDHYNHVRMCLEHPQKLQQEYSKPNILLLGPTGVGKTYLMRNIARLIGVPFVKADATKFSETGYVGSDVEDLVRDLVKAANGNTELAQYGIIYIDEIDKIASEAGPAGRDVSGRGVQINLLKLMEDSEVNLFSPSDMMGQFQAMMSMGRGKDDKKKQTISTRHILFIVSGAFDKLAENVKKRIEKASIGFAHDISKERDDIYHYLKDVATKDFIDYGFEPEFIGRLPVRVACEQLYKEDLAQILSSSEGSLLNQYVDDFKGYDINFSITDEAIDEVADQASKEKTGARGLVTVLERVFRDFKFELPSTAVESFEVNTDTIAKPHEALKALLLQSKDCEGSVLKADLERFIEAFEHEHGLKLSFAEDAQAYLIERALEQDKTIRGLCEEAFKDLAHGLGIIQRNTGTSEFVVTRALAENPQKELSEWVVKSFKNA